jgi:copper transport protein
MKRRTTSLLLAIALALLLTQPAAAHANLVRSTPAAGALLDTSPTSMLLEFSEELDPNFSQAQLFDSKNQLIEPGPGEIDPAAPRTLRLILPDLPKDSYTAIWRVRSAADGHITQGSVPFGVGVATTTSLIPPPGTPDPATLPPPPLDAIARWLNLLAAAIALGGLPFGLLVWRPALKKWSVASSPRPHTTTDHGLQTADNSMTLAIGRMTLIGGVLFLLTNVFFLLTQAAAAANVPLQQAVGAPVLQLLSGRSGLLWLARTALIFQIIVLAWRLPPAGGGPARLWWAMLVIAGVALLTLSMASHAAAEPSAALAVSLDWLHLSAMVAWLGGLIPFALAVRAARRNHEAGESDPVPTMPLNLLVARFSWLTAPCVAVLTLTGIYSYYLHIDRLDLLAATTYGRALLVKLGLFGVLLLLGGLNLFVLSTRLRAALNRPATHSAHSGHRLARAFGRSVRAELIAGALLLLAVGAMTSVAPSKAAWEAHEQQGIARAATVGQVDMILRIAPAQIGDNEFAVDVADRRPGAAAAPTKVLLRFDMLGMQMGKLQTEAQTTDKERYITRGSFTSMGGRWNIEVVLRRAGFDDVRHTFEVDIVRGAPFVISR